MRNKYFPLTRIREVNTPGGLRFYPEYASLCVLGIPLKWSPIYDTFDDFEIFPIYDMRMRYGVYTCTLLTSPSFARKSYVSKATAEHAVADFILEYDILDTNRFIQ